jgi:flagellar motor switch protein FliN/FliY
MSSTALNAAALASALINELANAIGALLGAKATAEPSASEIQPTWTVTIAVGDPSPGSVTVGLTDADCTQLVRASLGEDAELSEAAIVDMLHRVMAQAVAALRENPLGKGLLFCVETPSRLTTAPEEPAQFYSMALSPTLSPVVAVWTVFESPAGASTLSSGTRTGSSSMSVLKSGKGTSAAVPSNLDVILDIDLPLSVSFGQTDLSLETLTRLGPGSVIDLGRSPDDPVDVLVNGRLVARGEVVVVGGNYGVRILEVVSAADRVRSLRG